MDCGLYDRIVVVWLPAEQAACLQHMQTDSGQRGCHDGTKQPGREANHKSPNLAVIKDDWSCTNSFLCLCDTRAKGQLCFNATYSQTSQGVSRLGLPTAILFLNPISSTCAVCATHLTLVDSLRLIRKIVPSVLRKGEPLELLLRNSEH